ncbi:hypothetical protein BJ138DRAFT_1106664 [Hygrophoropsis aurantiaca]|uniref:Uncharacterized protein n=1 Tax=Hygrophoropsis aurantiaca TaxID=72124 RepID=A0ACB7ZVA6_9AGAM|nr:hypothetical protein BJ138DRAFT_1106664 [Hygrophoropsis aurantiaca]
MHRPYFPSSNRQIPHSSVPKRYLQFDLKRKVVGSSASSFPPASPTHILRPFEIFRGFLQMSVNGLLASALEWHNRIACWTQACYLTSDTSSLETANTSISRLLVFGNALLEERLAERDATAKQCSACLTELTRFYGELATAASMCMRANQRVFALQLQQTKFVLPGDDDLWSVYDDIVSTMGENKPFVERLGFETFLERLAPPPIDALYSIALVAQAECQAAKVAAECRYQRSFIQYQMHAADLQKADACCAVAQQAMDALHSHPSFIL